MAPRDLVHWALAESPDFASAQTLHARLRVAGKRIGLSTVYRVLRELVDAGTLDVIRDTDSGQLYRLRAGPHHSHYLLCRICGYSVALESEIVERWAVNVGEAQSFVDVEHTIKLMGVCAECSERLTPSDMDR